MIIYVPSGYQFKPLISTINWWAGIQDRTIQELLKNLDKVPDNPDELAYWTTAFESTAKNMCKDEDGSIEFVYCPQEKSMRFFVKNSECRNCLVKSIEIHLPLIPESLQGFFSVFKYNLKNMKFTT